MNAGLNALDRLVVLFSKLPGIGKKSASRLVYHILDSDPSYAETLAAELAGLHDAIKNCSRCGNYTETDPCPICTDPGRDHTLLCVVERAQDIRVIDESREFRGLFHVLGGLIAPLEGVNPGDLAIARLLDRVREEGIQEVILALNPTIEGDTTALYIQRYLKEKLPRGQDAGSSASPAGASGSSSAGPPEISRLASGLPVGGDLEYADKLTLSRSFRGRIKM